MSGYFALKKSPEKFFREEEKMEILRGNLQDPDFKNKLESLLKSEGKRIIIVTEEISCQESRQTIEVKKGLPTLPSWAVESLQKAIIHLVVCNHCLRSFKDFVA